MEEIKLDSIVEESTLNYDDKIYLSLNRKGFETEKDKIRFIKNVENVIRRSMEYKEFVSFIKYTLGNDFCLFTLEKDEETKDVELHHHPFTLFDIVKIVVDKYLLEDKEFNTFTIAAEVIDLHFKLKIGFVPLIKSLHRKFHNGYLKIPIEFVIGDYKYLVKNYPLDEDLKKKYEYYCSITKEDVSDLWYPGLKGNNPEE